VEDDSLYIIRIVVNVQDVQISLSVCDLLSIKICSNDCINKLMKQIKANREIEKNIDKYTAQNN